MTTGEGLGRDEWAAQEMAWRAEADSRAALPSRWARRWLRLDMRLRLVVVVAIAACVPLVASNPYLLRVAGLTGLYVALALGLNVVAGLAGLLDLGYVAFFGVGAYAYALLSSPQFDLHWPSWAVVPLVTACATGLGVLLGLPCLRLRGDYLAIVTLGFGQIAVLLFLNLDRLELPLLGLRGPLNITNGPNGIVGVDDLTLFGLTVRSASGYYWVILAYVALVFLAVYHLDRSRIGRAWRAIREDELAAQSMGVDCSRLKVLAFTVGAAIAGAAGALLAAWQGAVFPPNFDTNVLIILYSMVVLGGVGSIPGAVLGAIILSILPEALRDPTVARALLYGGLLVAVVRAARRHPARAAGVAGGVAALGVVVRVTAPTLFPRLFLPGGAAGAPAHGVLARLLGAVGQGVPRPQDPGTAGSVAFVVTVALLVAVTQVRGRLRYALLVPALYGLLFAWEVRLIAEPSVTRMLILGALLVLMMNYRPQGLLGERWVQTH